MAALGAAQAGTDSNITSLTGLTTPLLFSEGGTGTSTMGSNGQVLTSNGTSLYWTTPSSASTSTAGGITVPFTASESISAGAAVATTLYEAGAEAIDNSVIITGIPAGDTCTGGCGGAATSSYNFTVGNNPNRVLVAIIEGWSDNNNGAGPGTSVTYAGQSFTQAASNGCNFSGNACYESVSYLVAPPTGTNAIVTSDTNCGCVATIYSVYNAAQTGQPGATMVTTGSSGSVNTIADGEITFGAVDISSGSPSAGGTIYTSNTMASSTMAAGDSGVSNLYSIGTNMTLTNTNSQTMLSSIGILPSSAAVPGVENASAASSNQREAGFIGFAANGASAGGSVNVMVNGVVTGLSGIHDGVGYYLNNTNGSIGISAGSVTRKIGIGVSDTSLLLTNEW